MECFCPSTSSVRYRTTARLQQRDSHSQTSPGHKLTPEAGSLSITGGDVGDSSKTSCS